MLKGAAGIVGVRSVSTYGRWAMLELDGGLVSYDDACYVLDAQWLERRDSYLSYELRCELRGKLAHDSSAATLRR